jgi:hypothetical protein
VGHLAHAEFDAGLRIRKADTSRDEVAVDAITV